MIKVVINDPTEIRMGSPYRIGTAKITGDWQPNIPMGTYFESVFSSEDKTIVALIYRGGLKRTDGSIGLSFKVIIIDSIKKQVFESSIIDGGCNTLKIISPTKVECEVWNPGPYPGITTNIIIDQFVPFVE